MPHQPIIPSGLRPNLSRTDRLEPQRVEPALAMNASLADVLGVEGATLAADQSLSFGSFTGRGCLASAAAASGPAGRCRADSSGSGRRLCDRLSAGSSRAAGRRGGAGGRERGTRGSGPAFGAGFAGGHVAGRGAGAGRSGPRAGCRGGYLAGDFGRRGGWGRGSERGDTGHCPAAGCSGGRGIAGRVTFVRQVGRGGFRRSGAAFEAGGAGL